MIARNADTIQDVIMSRVDCPRKRRKLDQCFRNAYTGFATFYKTLWLRHRLNPLFLQRTLSYNRSRTKKKRFYSVNDLYYLAQLCMKAAGASIGNEVMYSPFINNVSSQGKNSKRLIVHVTDLQLNGAGAELIGPRGFTEFKLQGSIDTPRSISLCEATVHVDQVNNGDMCYRLARNDEADDDDRYKFVFPVNFFTISSHVGQTSKLRKMLTFNFMRRSRQNNEVAMSAHENLDNHGEYVEQDLQLDVAKLVNAKKLAARKGKKSQRNNKNISKQVLSTLRSLEYNMGDDGDSSSDSEDDVEFANVSSCLTVSGSEVTKSIACKGTLVGTITFQLRWQYALFNDNSTPAKPAQGRCALSSITTPNAVPGCVAYRCMFEIPQSVVAATEIIQGYSCPWCCSSDVFSTQHAQFSHFKSLMLHLETVHSYFDFRFVTLGNKDRDVDEGLVCRGMVFVSISKEAQLDVYGRLFSVQTLDDNKSVSVPLKPLSSLSSSSTSSVSCDDASQADMKFSDKRKQQKEEVLASSSPQSSVNIVNARRHFGDNFWADFFIGKQYKLRSDIMGLLLDNNTVVLQEELDALITYQPTYHTIAGSLETFFQQLVWSDVLDTNECPTQVLHHCLQPVMNRLHEIRGRITNVPRYLMGLREHYHINTLTPLEENDYDYDSDESVDTEWILEKTGQAINDMHDVSYSQKLFIHLWNGYMHHENMKVHGDAMYRYACRRFIVLYADTLYQKHIQAVMHIHLLHSVQLGILTPDAFEELSILFQSFNPDLGNVREQYEGLDRSIGGPTYNSEIPPQPPITVDRMYHKHHKGIQFAGDKAHTMGNCKKRKRAKKRKAK